MILSESPCHVCRCLFIKKLPRVIIKILNSTVHELKLIPDKRNILHYEVYTGKKVLFSSKNTSETVYLVIFLQKY